MTSDFFSDLASAKGAEQKVLEKLSSLTNDYEFIDISNEQEYWHKGDILAINKATGARTFIEVKDDSRIAETHNILCEERIFFYESKKWVRGNFYSDYEIYAIYSASENKIYIFDFSILKKIYMRDGYFTKIQHKENLNEVILLPFDKAVAAGALIAELEV